MIVLTIAVFALFALVIVSIARLAGGTMDWLVNLYSAQTPLPRPRGVQEEDLPHFVFRGPGQTA